MSGAVPTVVDDTDPVLDDATLVARTSSTSPCPPDRLRVAFRSGDPWASR
jgi:hypothetical protein